MSEFAEGVSAAIAGHPLIRVERGEVGHIPPPGVMSPLIIATGPLTSATLSAAIAEFTGREHLAFFDAISPIVLAETIDMSKVFRASRWNRSLRGDPPAAVPEGALCHEGEGDYLNCPLTRDEYAAFHQAIVSAEKATVHDFDDAKFFEGCLPIEVMAHRGVETLRFGPMKASGLTDPRTGRWPYAVVQLRQDNLAADHFSLVGFQTQLKWGEQARVLRMIPGLERAEFARYGMIHRNTYINAPTVLTETWQTRTRRDLFFAGQVSGVEGYVESAASGLIAGRNAARLVLGLPVTVPPTDDGHWRAGILRLARRRPVLRAVEHHLRHHARARHASAEQARAAARHEPPRARRPRRVAARDGAGRAGRRRPGAARGRAVSPLRDHARAFHEFLKYNRNVSAHTLRAYDTDLSQFLAFVAAEHRLQTGAVRASDFTTDAVRGFLGALHDRGASRASSARRLAALRTFARYLVREEVLAEDPTSLVGAPRSEQTLPAHLALDDMNKLLSAPDAATVAGRRDQAILELFYASGLRLSELVDLDIGDVNLAGRIARVRGKGGKERLVPFNPASAEAIRRMLQDPRAQGIVRDTRTARAGRAARGATSPAAVPQPPRRTGSPPAAWTGSSGATSGRRPSGGESARTPCATPSRRISCRRAPTCGRSRSCSGTRASARRSATHTSTSAG